MLTLSQFADLRNFLPYYQSGRISSSFIAQYLGVTAQHVRRLMKSSLIAKPRIAHNQLSSEIQEFIIGEKESNLSLNCQWLSEIASDRFGRPVSQSSVWRILKAAGLLFRQSINRQPRTRFETNDSGDLVQMDTTWGYWLNGQRIYLILLLDDYSRYILHAKFVRHDSAIENMTMIHEVVMKYGVFKLLYTDNASFFKAIRHNQSRFQNHTKNEYESEITRACREAGITHITHKPYQPQGKGKIERLFRFIQERFIEDEISSDPSHLPLYVAQKKLDCWVSWYNDKHIVRTTKMRPKERFNPDGFKPLLKDRNLCDVFCFKDTRKVDKCNQFSYLGKIYTIPRKYCMVAYKVNLHVNPLKSIRVWHNSQFICELPIQIDHQTIKNHLNS